MDPVVGGWDLVGIILACLAVGGAGGLAYDLTEPVLRRRRATETEPAGEAAFGDNRLMLPRLKKRPGRAAALDAGLLGPILVGGTAAVAAVFALAIVRPDAPSQIERDAVVRELEASSATAQTVAAVEKVLDAGRDPYVPWDRLILIGLVAGFGGAAVVRSLRARLITAVGGVAFDARVAGIREGAELSKDVVAKKADDNAVQEVDAAAKRALEPAIETAVAEHVEKLATMSAYAPAEVD